MKRKGFTMQLTMLGTGHALATKCYNACFALQDDAMGKAPGCTFLDDRVPDFSKYGRLVAVDTRRRSRLRHVWPLLDNPGTRIEVWDHHPETSDDVHAHVCHAEICGAVTTLLIEEIQKRNIAVSRETATVLGLGIYSDTGSFSFSSVTQRDFAAAGWLLGRGMDINIISEKTAFSMTKEHIRALNALLESAQTYHINGADVVLAEATLDSYLDDFAFLAHKMMEMEKFDILFAIGRMDDRIQIVARSRSHAVNVGAVCSAFGGGGHAYAASASVRDKTLSEVRDGILTQLYLQEEGEKTARDYMSQPAIGIEEGHTIAEADELMLHFGLKTMPVFAPMTRRCTGLIDSQITQKAISHGLAGAPLTDYMRRNLKTLPVTATLRDITTVIVGARQRLVPIVSGDSSVVGVVSRTDLINIFAQEPGRMNPTDRAPKSRNMGRTMRDRLPKDVLDILEKAGALGRSRQTPVYVVGGFVRDLLLKTPNHDIDLVVEGDGIGFARAFAGVLGGRGDLLGIADEHGLEEVTGQQTGARLEDAGVGAFGKDDGFGALFQGCDQLTKHIEIPPNFCAAGGRQELTGTVYTSFFRVSTPNHKKFTIFP